MSKFRKLALLILILLSTAGPLCAQNYYLEDNRTFYGGLIAGGAFSQIDGDNFAGYNKFGVTVGGIAYAQLAGKIAASIEILYSQRGSNSNKTQPSNTRQFVIHRYNINLSYAEVPLMLNYFDKRKSHFGAGFSYSQLINQSETVSTTPEFPTTIDLTQYEFKKYDINFIIGGKLHLYKGLFLNARFQYSLVPVRTNIYQEFGRAKQFNNMWVLRLMYLFG